MTVNATHLRELLAAATPRPWMDGYCSLHSKPIFDEHNRLEREIPEDADDDDPRWAALPESAFAGFPVVAGDTATKQARADMQLIVGVINSLPELLAVFEAAERLVFCDSRTLGKLAAANHDLFAAVFAARRTT